MSKINIKYDSWKDRQAKATEQQTLGLTMLSDTFDDPNWVAGKPQIGVMIFGTPDERPIAEVIIDSDKIAYLAASTIALKLDIIAKKLGLL